MLNKTIKTLILFFSLNVLVSNYCIADINCIKDFSVEEDRVNCIKQKRDEEKQNMESALRTLYRELEAHGGNYDERIKLYQFYQSQWLNFAKSYCNFQSTDGDADKVPRKFFNCLRSFYKARTNLIFKDIKLLYGEE